MIKFFRFLMVFVLSSSCADITPYQKELLSFRKEKDFQFRNLPDSPIPDSLKPSFKGLSYFPINENWIIQAQFIPQIDSLNSDFAGYIKFSYQNKIFQLTVFWQDTIQKNELFLPFRDKTSGLTTYGGGRYLNIPYSGKKDVLLDFNYVYHPFCVYNPDYICQKPPKENFLDFEVTAGEKL